MATYTSRIDMWFDDGVWCLSLMDSDDNEIELLDSNENASKAWQLGINYADEYAVPLFELNMHGQKEDSYYPDNG